MEESALLSNLSTGGIGAAIALAVYAVYRLLSRRWRREENAAETARRNHQSYLDARRAWSQALRLGDAAGVAYWKRLLDGMRAKGWNNPPPPSAVALVILACITAGCAGCANRRAETGVTRTVVLSEHVRHVAPGETVPPLPEGETLWWLCSPTGLEQLLPADAPALAVGRGTDGRVTP